MMFCVVTRRGELLPTVESDLKKWYPLVKIVLCQYDRDFERVMYADPLPVLIVTDDSVNSLTDDHSMDYGHEISYFAGDHDIGIVRFGSHGYWPSLLRAKIAVTLDIRRGLHRLGRVFQQSKKPIR